MKKIGYFFYSFLPLLLAVGIQIIASLFMMGVGGVALLLKPSEESFFVRIYDLLLDSEFNGMIMVVYSLIVICAFGIWYYCRFEGDFTPGVRNIFTPKKLLGIAILIPGAQYASSYICGVIQIIIPSWMEQYEELLKTAGLDNAITPVLLLYSVILAPICEELIFRGVTLNSIKRALPFWAANIFQAVLFGAFHMNWVQGIYAFTIGLILGYICEKGGSIYCSILFHILFNFWGTVISQLLPSEGSTLMAIISFPVTIISFALGFMLFHAKAGARTSKIQNNLESSL